MNGKINNVYITQGCNVDNQATSNNISFRSNDIKDSFESTTKRNNNGKTKGTISFKQNFFNKLTSSFNRISTNSSVTQEKTDVMADFEAFKKEIYSYEHLSKENVSRILGNLTPEKTKFARMLCQDKAVPDRQIGFILRCTEPEDVDYVIEIYDLLKQDKTISPEEFSSILKYTEGQNIEFVKRLCADRADINEDEDYGVISCVLDHTRYKKGCSQEEVKLKVEMYDFLKGIEGISPKEKALISGATTSINKDLAKRLCIDKDFPKDEISLILDYINKENFALAEALCADKDFPKDKIYNILQNTQRSLTGPRVKMHEFLSQDKTFPKELIPSILNSVGCKNLPLAKALCSYPDFPKDKVESALHTYAECTELMAVLSGDDEIAVEKAKKIFAHTYSNGRNMSERQIVEFSKSTTDEDFAAILELCLHLEGNQISRYSNKGLLQEVCNSPNYKENKDILLEINKNKDLGYYTRDALVDIVLKLHNGDYSKLSLKERVQQINALNKAQSTDSLSPKVKELLDIDEEISRLQDSIKRAIYTTPVSKEDISQMMAGFFANNNLEVENTLLNANFEQYYKDGLPLTYSREAFIYDLSSILEKVSDEEKTNILNKLDITLTKSEDNSVGYDGIINMSKLSADGVEGEVLSIATRFIKENSIITGDEKLDATLNSLIQGMPEFINVIGKQQHKTHSYSVDIHTLKVLKEAMKNPEYKNLSNQDKFCLKFSTLLHDIAKSEGVVDDGHALLSALYARDILNKITMPCEVKDRIYELNKNHHWLAEYNKEEIASDKVAALFRRTGDLKIAKIMAEADLKGVDSYGGFYSQHASALSNEKQQPIQDSLNKINSTGQMFLTSKIVNSKKIPIVQYKGKEYKILDFTKMSKDTDLEQFGFEPGANVDNFRIWLHMVNEDSISNLENVYSLQDPTYQGFLCASYASVENHPTYCNYKFGVSLESEQANIANAAETNQGSGCEKNFYKFSRAITDENRIDGHRTLISNSIKDTLNLSDEEYADLFTQIQSYKYASQLDNIPEIKIGDRSFTGKQIKEAIFEADDLMLMKEEALHSEANLYTPKINAIVAKVCRLDDIPQDLLDYALKYNLPIYLLGN